jgi:hypothetical protein
MCYFSNLFWKELYMFWTALLSIIRSLNIVYTAIGIFQYISNKMQLYTVYLYLETALHVSGVISTHHQERIQLYLQHLVFVTPLLLPAADSLPRDILGLSEL